MYPPPLATIIPKVPGHAMAITKLILPALAFVGSVLGKFDPVPWLLRSSNHLEIKTFRCSLMLPGQCSTAGTATIKSAADASPIASCSTFSGSIAIPTDLTDAKDQNGHNQLSIEHVQVITGNLTITNAISLSTLTLGGLQQLGGFELGSLTVLSELNMPAINRINVVNFTALPALQDLSFGNNGITRASSVLITNTGLSSLQGINNLDSIDTFNVNNNQALQNISLQVTSITNNLDIEANTGGISGLTTSFPMLETAQNMTFRNCSSISLPALANVSEYLGLYGNGFDMFSAPNLTTAGGVVFVDNTDLTNISLPQLVSINGTYQIANNTQLTKIDGFKNLAVIKGALDFSGNFTE